MEQVSVETNNYSPELGNVAGAIVNMVIKSGTNRISGNGFYYWRDNELAATPWATNRAGGRKSEFTRKIFGGTIGGPIAKDKLFFFADYQGGRQESPPADSFTTVIPDAWRNGDLSSLLRRHPNHRSRSADRPAVPEQPDSDQPLQPVRAQPARQRSALPAVQRHPRDLGLPQQLPRPGRPPPSGRTSST